MRSIKLVQLGNREGHYKGDMEIALAANGDVLLTLCDEQPTAFRDEPPAPVTGCVYLTPQNAEVLALALTRAVDIARRGE